MTGDREQAGRLRSEVAVRHRPPANGDPADGHPADNYPADDHPADNYPADGHPADNYPAGNHPAGNHAADNYPAGDQAADSAGQPSDLVASLFRAHAVALVRVATLLLGDRQSAEDVVQDAFFGLYRGLPGLRDRSKALPYLRASVINGSRSVLRARKRAFLRRVQHEPPVWSAESAAMDGEDRKAMLAAVARLPRRAREVLALRYYLDLADHEIAAALGISRATVSSTASRALAKLARELKEEP
jgi:RNA polymerase sigma-70 factor (sigma-E family)